MKKNVQGYLHETHSTSEESRSDFEWDFFIAYARRDLQPAKALYNFLSKSSTVFLDEESLEPGENWDEFIPEALSASQIVIVLVTHHSNDAHYLREEILSAVYEERNSNHRRVVPIIIKNPPDASPPIPYGLSRKHAIVISESHLAEAAHRLRDLHENLNLRPDACNDRRPKPPFPRSQPEIGNALPHLKRLVARLSKSTTDEMTDTNYFEGRDGFPFKFLPVLFRPCVQMGQPKSTIRQIIPEWLRSSEANGPLILILHFPLDATEQLLASLFLLKDLYDPHDFPEISWCDSAEAFETWSETLVDNPETLYVFDFAWVDWQRYLLVLDERGGYSARIAFQLMKALSTAHGRQAKSIVAVPRFLLADSKLQKQIEMFDWVVAAEDVFVSRNHGQRPKPPEALLRRIPSSLRFLAEANSSSVFYILLDIVLSLESTTGARTLTPGKLADVARALHEQNFPELAFRIELALRGAIGEMASSPVALDATLAEGDRKFESVAIVQDLRTAPRACSRAALMGSAGSGKTVALKQIEQAWALPPVAANRVGESYVDSDSTFTLAPLSMPGRAATPWLPVRVSANGYNSESELDDDFLDSCVAREYSLMTTLSGIDEEIRQLVAHKWVAGTSEIRQLHWMFSSPVLLLIDDIESLDHQRGQAVLAALAEYKRAIEDRRLWICDFGIYLACRRLTSLDLTGIVDSELHILPLGLASSSDLIHWSLGRQPELAQQLTDSLRLCDSQMAQMARNPFLLDKMCRIAKLDVGLHDLNLFKLIDTYVNSMASQDTRARLLVSRQLPEIAFQRKLKTTLGIPIERSLELSPELQALGHRMNLLICHRRNSWSFRHRLLLDYFAAIHAKNQLDTEDGEEQVREILAPLLTAPPALGGLWRNFLRILAGAFAPTTPALAEQMIKTVQGRYPQLAAECLGELEAFLSRETMDRMAGKVLEQSFSQPSVTPSREHQLKIRIATLEALGRSDPRIQMAAPGKAMVDFPEANGESLFSMAKFPVTNMEFQRFVEDGGYEDPALWQPFLYAREYLVQSDSSWSRPMYWGAAVVLPNYPVVGVSVFEAIAYCRWLTMHYGGPGVFCLPTEEQWCLAAGISDLRVFETIRRLRQRLHLLRDQLISDVRQAAESGEAPGVNSKLTRPLHVLRSGFKAVTSWWSGKGDRETSEDLFKELYKELSIADEDLPAMITEVRNFLNRYRYGLTHSNLTPVGSMPADGTELHDMFGNIWEWCDDWLPLVRPESRPSSEEENLWLPVIIRGGPAPPSTDELWSIVGNWFDPFARFHRVGFRVCYRAE